MYKNKLLLILIIAAFVAGCKTTTKTGSSTLAPPTPADTNATAETKALYANMAKLAKQGIMFGHEDDPAYGLGWWAEEGRSDVKEVTGSYPAIFGWDLGTEEREFNIDTVLFSDMKRWIIEAYNRGAINTISWHMYNPVSGGNTWDTTNAVKHILPGGDKNEFFNNRLDIVADFLLSLKTDEGIFVPILFRPWHEHTGNWFWWGSGNCTVKEYTDLWKYTVTYLRDKKNIHHLLYTYSPDRFGTKENYLERYPGDEYIDILGFDDYWDFGNCDSAGIQRGIEQLRIVVNLAEEKNKIPALSETGLSAIPNTRWFTDCLLKPIKEDSIASKISYLLVWRNRFPHHAYVPYPGHPAESNFVEFYNDPVTIFENDLPDMYSVKE
ncbi:MAG: hypothetical protein JXJ22_08205 [Bacteroidales bacterium]|nr:hypothetical protein [Bacteroidales bacterium]